jgi:hypothetical protein
MTRFLSLICLACGLAGAADLASVRRVYLLPMAHGMDQYMADHLTADHIFEVVTDPKLADALFTDHLGPGFQSQYDEIFPKPEEPKPAKPAKADPEPKAKAGDEHGPLDIMAPPENKLANPASASSFGRSKGNIFLVDTKSHQVIWSTYQPPKAFGGKELNRTASDIVSRLKKDLNPKK